jgi:molecular chaperone DnaK
VIIGIDLGTTNSVVAVLDGRDPRVLVNEEGQRVTPSVVALDADGAAVVGAVARRQALTNPKRTVASVKRFMGLRWAELTEDDRNVPFDLTEADGGRVGVSIDGRTWAPEEIAARILSKLKRAAEAALGEPVTGAVITVPAYFNDAQRQATRRAGEIAGLEVKRIINEPTAAALAYGLQNSAAKTIAVFDLGGGTFDISILDVADDVIEVRATAGDTRLGGDDVDRRIGDWLLDEFERATGVDARGDRMVLQRVRDAAERAKIELSTTVATEVHLPFLAAGPDGPAHLNATLTRARLEPMIADWVARAITCCERAVADARITVGEIDEVLLVGGSTRIPLVRERVAAYFQRPPNHTLNPDEAVALGAAVQAGVMSGATDAVLLLDVTPLTLGVETRGGLFTGLIERNTTIPTRATKTFSTASDQQRTVEVHVLQGERAMAAENRTLGRFELVDLPALPRAVPRIDVRFEIDADGIVSVSATERTTGREAGIRITDAGDVDEASIASMIASAEASASADEERRAAIERRNALDNAIVQLERRRRELSGSVEPSVLDAVDAAVTAAVASATDAALSDAAYVRANSALLEAATTLEDASMAANAAARAGTPPGTENA